MAEAYKEGKTYSVRLRQGGHEVYVSGHKSKTKAEQAAGNELAARLKAGKPRAGGPGRIAFARALQDYALERLPSMKGAAQEARRINKYLRAACLDLLVVVPVREDEKHGALFHVSLTPFTDERKVPNGLGKHRRNLLTKTAGSDEHRAVLATTKVTDVSRHQLQLFVKALEKDQLGPATIALERALIRSFFNYALTTWNWHALAHNPATKLEMPTIDNNRERVLSAEEQSRLDAVLQDSRNSLLKPVTTLLRETAMRASEPLEHARWGDVDWKRNILSLRNAKAGKRDVPLSPAAVQALRDLEPGQPNEPIVRVTYEALRAGWRRACERAGIEDLHIQDLRHTAATRMALKTGNIFLVKALTGHKTLSMVERYVNVKAEDAVKVLHAPEIQPNQPEVAQASSGHAVTGGPAALALATEQLQALMVQLQTMTQSAAAKPVAAAAEHGVAVGEQPADEPPEDERPAQVGKVVPIRRRA